ncbi:MAG: hypothetical protein L3J12_04100 [Spirochaetales bacterium]|nr:hypothetical protein [Spirochaetales bacterium]
MKRIDFMFAIGYQGVSAIVDKHAKNQYGRLSSLELAEKGFFKSAFCAALYDENNSDLSSIVGIYNNMSGDATVSVDSMKRLLGVFSVPDDISKVIYV